MAYEIRSALSLGAVFLFGFAACSGEPFGSRADAGVDATASDAPVSTSQDAASDPGAEPSRTKGEACSESAECSTTFCVDGVCCATACEGCMVCNSPDSVGTCSLVAQGDDPHGACKSSAPSCSGTCDGKGACVYPPSGTPCGSPACDESSASLLLEPSCDGQGACTRKSRSCGTYLCNPVVGECFSDCTPDSSQCVGDAYCKGGTCVARRPLGSPCTSSLQCASSHCVDDVCCDGPCDGVCESCKLAGKAGVCTPIPADTDPEGDCTGVDACKGVCGSSRACKYPDATTACGVAFCTPSISSLTTYSCNGHGGCDVGQKSCGYFGCVSTSCNTTCVADTDCSKSAFCTKPGCYGKKIPGESCTRAQECESDYCLSTVQGLRCCSSTCDSPLSCESGQCLCNGVVCTSPGKCRLWYADTDGDGFGDPHNALPGCDNATIPTGYVANADDCYDKNVKANPGQQLYFDVHRGDGSFDYDCSQKVEKYYIDFIPAKQTTCMDCKFGGYPCESCGAPEGARETFGIVCHDPHPYCGIAYDRGFKGPIACGAAATLLKCNPEPRACSEEFGVILNVKQRCH